MPEILMEFSSVKEASFSILRSLPWVGTWLGYAHPGLRRRTFRAWWNSESCTLGDRVVLRCNGFFYVAGLLQAFCNQIASDVYPADDISARGDADAFAFSDSKHKALRLQAPSCRSEIP